MALTLSKKHFDEEVRVIKAQIPKFEIRYKNESWTSKVLGVLVWIFNRKYMTSFTTTRYPHVYFPSRKYVEENYTRAFKILAHEFVHLWDRYRCGIWFSISYMLPQALALLFVVTTILSAIWLPWPWIVTSGTCALLSACPLPAYWRMKWELRGYTMNMAINYWCYGAVHANTMVWIAEKFTGWDYYKMWPFKNGMADRVTETVHDIKMNHLSWPFPEIKRVMRNGSD